MTQEQLNQLLDQAARQRDWTDELTERELEAFSFFTMGFWPQQICEEMNVTPHELKRLKRSIQKRLGLKSELDFLRFVADHLDGPGSLNPPRFGVKTEPAPNRYHQARSGGAAGEGR